MKINCSELGRLYGLDRRTVKKLVDAGGIPTRKKKQEFSKWDPWENEIREKMSIPGASIRAVHEYFREILSDENLPGTYESLKAFIRKKEIPKGSRSAAKTHVHFETDMGVQIQVDWIENLSITLKSGEIINFNIYSATLGYSREHIFIYSPSKTEEDFIRCTVEVFKRLGGTTRELLTDNMSAIVSVDGHSKKVHPRINQFFKDLDVELKLCKVATPQTKGKVESSNRFKSWLLPYNNELEDEDQLRNLVDNVLTRRVNNQVNESTGLPPVTLFNKEKEYLNLLPSSVLLDSYLKQHTVRKVPQTLLVSWKGNGYSVPKKYLGQRVHLYEIKESLYIYDEHEDLITIHSISDKKKNYHFGHYADGLNMPGQNRSFIEEVARQNLERFEESFLYSKEQVD